MLARFFSKNRRPDSSRTDQPGQNQEQFKYCPSCGDEFRAEFEKCGVCDELLIVAAEHPGTTGESDNSSGVTPAPVALTGADNLVSARQGTLMEMKRVRRLLEKQGIASLIAGDGPDCTRSCCGSSSFILQIRAEDGTRAATILAEDFRRSTAVESHARQAPPDVVIDERAEEISCPACGFSFSAQEPCCPECGLCFQG